MTVGDDRQHGGNDGYDDEVSAYYSWDDTVANHSRIRVGDVIALWDKRVLLGVSVIETIDTAPSAKRVYRCPACGDAKD